MAAVQDHRSSQHDGDDDGSGGGKYVGLAALERARGDESPSGGGLSFGLTSYHLRILCESPWEGGGGYSPREISLWTPDQVYHRLAKLDVLKNKSGVGRGGVKSLPAGVMGKADADGKIQGRDKDGNPIKAKITGKSLARRLMEEEEAKKKGGRERRKEKRRKRRERRRSNGG